MGEVKRRCTKCKVEKPIDQFDRRPDSASGLKSQCKVCVSQYQAEWRAANRSRVRERQRGWRQANRAADLLYQARHRAKRDGVPFNLTAADIVIPDRCPVLGIELKRGSGRAGWTPNSPTLDRIIPALGYVRGNIAVISFRANAIKHDATAEELRLVANWLAEQVQTATTRHRSAANDTGQLRLAV